MIEILLLLMTFLVLGYVLYPFYQPRYRWAYVPMEEEDPQIQHLQETKKEVLSAIKEIEFEHQMGKLSLSDYEKLRSEYQKKALRVLQELDRLNQPPGGVDQLEEEIRAYRYKLKQGQQIQVRFCPECGAAVKPFYKFCVQCGRQLLSTEQGG